MKIKLAPDWSEFLSVLIAHRVRFLIVGGHAVAAHAEPRFTEDLDVFVSTSAANAARLRAALIEFGFGDAITAASEEDFTNPESVFMLGRKPYRIDILMAIDGVTFADAWASRVEADFVSKPLFIIGRDALIKNKRAANRPKDLFDLTMLDPSSSKQPKKKAPTKTTAAKSQSTPKRKRRDPKTRRNGG